MFEINGLNPVYGGDYGTQKPKKIPQKKLNSLFTGNKGTSGVSGNGNGTTVQRTNGKSKVIAGEGVSKEDVAKFEAAVKSTGFDDKFKYEKDLKAQGYKFYNYTLDGAEAYYNKKTGAWASIDIDNEYGCENVFATDSVINEVFYDKYKNPLSGRMAIKQDDDTYTYYDYEYDKDGNKVITNVETGMDILITSLAAIRKK